MNKQAHYSYRLKTESCWSHTLRKPDLSFSPSDHYNGEEFFNYVAYPAGYRRRDLIKWLYSRKPLPWEEENTQAEIPAHAGPQNRPHASMDDWQVWFIGHATVLIQIGPYNFLTDPVWADYVSPQQGTGPKRSCTAGIALEQLPEIHAVLLSHNHYDHMDLATLRWLHKKFAMPIYTGLGNSFYLPKKFQVIEMDWWQAALLHKFQIVYTPAQHGSGRGLRDRNRALWGGFSIIHETGHCFFAGDTGYSPHFKQIHAELGAPRIALLPIGAYEPRELMQYMHMNPQEAFQAHLDLAPRRSLAIHYRTFQLTDEGREQPEQDLNIAMQNSSKLLGPFYCIREGRRLIV
ncbi:MBL fold metallo-hydrolase [Acinetobacter radioresistens]|uniref:MBL fold metallo-hydrolase n=1 Tax=Acinetobacter radioresistens TaxID=40216 RepID=UPI0032125997